jgi:phage terminase small subunit
MTDTTSELMEIQDLSSAEGTSKLSTKRTHGNGKLTEQEYLFCEHLLATDFANKSESARQAGYSPRSANTYCMCILDRPHIKQYLARRREFIEKDWGFTRNYKLRELKRIIKEGKDADKLKAIEIANKMQGDNSADKHVTATINMDVDLDLDSTYKLVDDLRKSYESDF